MKPVIVYISLLVFSGLICIICNHSSSDKTSGQIKPVQAVINPPSKNTNTVSFNFYTDIMANAFPVLKNLN